MKAVRQGDGSVVLTLTKKDAKRLLGLFDFPDWLAQPSKLAEWLEAGYDAISGVANTRPRGAEERGYRPVPSFTDAD